MSSASGTSRSHRDLRTHLRTLDGVHPCFRDIPCGTLQQYWRDGDSIDNAGFGDCTERWDELSSDAKAKIRELGFHTLDNSSTPAANALFWRRFIGEAVLDVPRSQYLLDVLDATGDGYANTDAINDGLIDNTGHKYGNVPTRRAWVGLTWDDVGAERVLRHSVSIYTKGFSTMRLLET